MRDRIKPDLIAQDHCTNDGFFEYMVQYKALGLSGFGHSHFHIYISLYYNISLGCCKIFVVGWFHTPL